MTRSEFIKAAGATFAVAVADRAFAESASACGAVDYAALQQEIDLVTPKDFAAFETAKFAALKRLDEALGKILAEVKSTVVTDKPAVWFVYNMGVVVKTKEACFSIDLMHPRATELAPLLDFALITHNHGDHFTEEFYRTMNGAGKTVISNFKDNYTAHFKNKAGGYTRAVKTFKLRDVEVRTTLTDHNGYLVDFTTAFEIKVGDCVIYHSGDCSNVTKLNPTAKPDLWIVHPYCGMKVADGVAKFHPVTTVIAHLNELGHARDRWRWTWEQGLKAKAQAEEAGGKAIVPVWGERIV